MDRGGSRASVWRRATELTIATILIAFAGVFPICFMKGAFGGCLQTVQSNEDRAVDERPLCARSGHLHTHTKSILR